MGTNHARVLAGLPDTTLVGIVDPLPAHRMRATELIGCRTFTSLDELIAEGVDAVTVAVPNIGVGFLTYYNADMWKSLGLHDAPPTSLDDFIDLAEKGQKGQDRNEAEADAPAPRH